MTSYTVTVSSTAPNSQGLLFRVKVLTGATEGGGASGTDQNGLSGTLEASITPVSSNSYIEFAVESANSGTLTAATNNTLDDNFDDTTIGAQFGSGFYSGAVASGTPVTVGVSSSTNPGTFAGYEVKPSGGSTPVVDASSPAVVQNDANPATGTTASFSPPAGSVLVVAIGISDNVQTENIPVSVSSTPSLTWTQRALASPTGFNFSQAAVFTATVPSGAATPPPLPLGRAVTGKRGRKGTSQGSARPLLHIEEVVQPLGALVRGRAGRKGRAQGSPAPLLHIEEVIPPKGATVRGKPGRKGSSKGSPLPLVPPPVPSIQPPAATGKTVTGRKARKGSSAGSPLPEVHPEILPAVTGMSVRGRPGKRGSSAGSKPIPVALRQPLAVLGALVRGRPGRKGSSQGSNRIPVNISAVVTPQQGTVTATAALAATVTITNKAAGSVAITDTLAGNVTITSTAAGTVNISNQQAGTVTIVNEL